MITAPYNFVPLNKEVFYPSWSEDVSHDVPFADGESGVIEIEIEAQSPIFIRNHYSKGDNFYTSKDGTKISEDFCHIKLEDGSKQYYIPGSSFKGMTRSVLEIISFAKMRVDEERLKTPLSVRDMTPKQYKATSEIKKDLYNHNLVGTANGIGLLKFNEDGSGILTEYTIEMQEGYKTSFGIRTIYYEELRRNGFPQYQQKSNFEEKYKAIPPYSTITVKSIPKTSQSRRFASKYDPHGEEALIVCNGYIDGRDGGKKYEFILAPSDKKRTIEIENSIIDNFKKVYFSGTNDLGTFWQKQLMTVNGKKHGIPVFLSKSNKGKIQAIGLTQLFKIAYNKTLFEALSQDKDDRKLDLAETIFGTEKEKFALKGRVIFGHLKSDIVKFESETKEEVLGTPNPTYYPNYIRQTDLVDKKVNKYITLMDSSAQIAGWKRYPLQNRIQSYPLPKKENGKLNHDVATKFKPLDSGTKFTGKIVFHNLKKAEIGALLSALTFHGRSGKCFHNIGMAKSLGYGKIAIYLTPKKLQYSIEDYLTEFETTISKEIPEWINSQQLTELFAMSDNSNTRSLKYQLLENDRQQNEFVNAKKEREYLLPYSQSKNTDKQKLSQREHQVRINQNPVINKGAKISSNNQQPVQKSQTTDSILSPELMTKVQELEQKLPTNPLASVANALSQGVFKEHTKIVASYVKNKLVEQGKWQDIQPPHGISQKNYQFSMKIKQYL